MPSMPRLSTPERSRIELAERGEDAAASRCGPSPRRSRRRRGWRGGPYAPPPRRPSPPCGGETERGKDAAAATPTPTLPRKGEGARHPQPIDREQPPRDHAHQRDALDHVGEIDRHAGRARHRAGAVEDDGEEERGGDRAERVQLGERRDDDAGIAVAGGEVGGDLEADAADLARAGQPGERAGDRARRSMMTRPTFMPA